MEDGVALLGNEKNNKRCSSKRLLIIGAIASSLVVFCVAAAFLLSFTLINSKKEPLISLTCNVDENSSINKLNILSDDFQAKMHAEIQANVLKEIRKNDTLSNAVIYLYGVSEEGQRQERNFLYMTGVFWHGYEFVLDVATGTSVLLAPRIPQREAIWNLPYIPTLEQIREKFGVSRVYYTDNRTQVLAEFAKDILLVSQPTPSDFNSTFRTIDSTFLPNLFTTIRAVKTFRELQVMRYANQVSSAAHIALMTNVRPNLWEYQLEALFLFETDKCSLRKQAYDPICGSGKYSAVLHYVNNDQQIKDASISPKQSIPEDIVLVDAGAEFVGYASDITRTYPSTGKFTPEQAQVYNAVLNTQETAIQALRPGIPWNNITMIASRALLSNLQSLEFVAKDVSVDRLYNLGIHKLFQPHGLGHLLGLDVHDTSVYPQNLLLPNMVITIEPGIYFIPFLFEQATPEQQQVLNMSKLRMYYNFGGIRIEDDILITDVGYEIMTKVPKTVQDVESLMARR